MRSRNRWSQRRLERQRDRKRCWNCTTSSVLYGANALESLHYIDILRAMGRSGAWIVCDAPMLVRPLATSTTEGHGATAIHPGDLGRPMKARERPC